jgi:hypothetical protein
VIYTLSIVGSVRCVYEKGLARWGSLPSSADTNTAVFYLWLEPTIKTTINFDGRCGISNLRTR